MHRILVVSYDLDTMTLLKSLLELKGYEVECTADTRDLDAILHAFQPEAVMVDQLLVQAITHINNSALWSTTPLLTLSGNGLPSSAGAHISKPFTVSDIVDKLNALPNRA